MRIQVCSDLHLEFAQNRKWLSENPLIPKGDVLLIAGDTYHLNKDFAKLDFIHKISDEFEDVFIIPGNHEYYDGYDVSSAGGGMHESVLRNVHIVNNETVQIQDVKFIFTTLWTKIEKYVVEVMRGMMDFKAIKCNGMHFTVNDYNAVHEKCMNFLSAALNSNGKKVVVTHHLPSSACNVDEFKGSVLNEAFCVDLTRLIENSEIDGWIYGHSHRNKDDFEINGTRMISNQLGYVPYNEHWDFNPQKTFDVCP